MLTVFELERQLKGPTFKATFWKIHSKMHLARSGGTAEAGRWGEEGWTDRWQRTQNCVVWEPSRQTAWVGGEGDITHMI